MGNDPVKKEHKEVKLESPDVKINHEKFHHFKYLEAEDLIQITTEVESQKDIKAWDSDLKRLNAFQDKETLLIPNRHEFTPKGFCGNVGSVKIYYENYPYLFEEEIDNRINMNKHFEEEELWYLLYSLVSSARDFNSIDRKIGDVRPYNIFINEEGQIKIANIFSWPYEKTNFQKTAFEKQLTYLSPQEMVLISKGNHQNTTNKILSESFSIGVTLLQSGLLFNARQLYSIQHYSFDLQKFNQKLNEWQNLQFEYENNTYTGYSQLLKQIVIRLCSPEQSSRLSSLQVQSILRPYQNQILNLKQFDHQHIKFPGYTQPSPVQGRPVQVGYSSSGVGSLHPNAPVFSIPQQTIKINAQIEPKGNSPRQIETGPVGSGPNVVRFGNEQFRYVAEQPQAKFYEQPQTQSYEQPQTQFYEQQFAKYATLNHHQPPTYQATHFEASSNYKTQLPNQQYQQQFHKYSNLNQSPPNTTTTNTANILSSNNIPSNYNTINISSNFNAINVPPNFNTSNVPSNLNANSYQGGSSIPVFNFTQKPNFLQPTFTTSTYSPVVYNSQASRPINSQVTSQMTLPTNFAANDNSSDFLKKIDEQLENSRKQFPS